MNKLIKLLSILILLSTMAFGQKFSILGILMDNRVSVPEFTSIMGDNNDKNFEDGSLTNWQTFGATISANNFQPYEGTYSLKAVNEGGDAFILDADPAYTDLYKAGEQAIISFYYKATSQIYLGLEYGDLFTTPEAILSIANDWTYFEKTVSRTLVYNIYFRVLSGTMYIDNFDIKQQ